MRSRREEAERHIHRQFFARILDTRYRDTNAGGEVSSARWNEFVTRLLSPPLQYRLFRGMRPLPFEDRSLHAVYSYLKDRVFDDEETTEPTKRKERGGGPNFIPNPRNLLSSPVQVAKRNPSPKDPAYLDEHPLPPPRV